MLFVDTEYSVLHFILDKTTGPIFCLLTTMLPLFVALTPEEKHFQCKRSRALKTWLIQRHKKEKSCLIKMQKTTYCVVANQRCTPTIQFLYSQFMENYGSGGRKIVRAREIYIYRKIVFPKIVWEATAMKSQLDCL